MADPRCIALLALTLGGFGEIRRAAARFDDEMGRSRFATTRVEIDDALPRMALARIIHARSHGVNNAPAEG
jgi:hypothetical protein